MKNKNNLKQEDIQLFRKSIGEVVKTRQNTVLLKKKLWKQSFSPKKYSEVDNNFFNPAEEFIPEKFRVSPTDEIRFSRLGIQSKIFRKLKRGQLPILANLDLHGMTLYNAKLALKQFISKMHCYKAQSCVRLIHGKGYGSKDGIPKLKQHLQGWLQEEKNVLAYSSCTYHDGGTGAIYVLLKRRRG